MVNPNDRNWCDIFIFIYCAAMKGLLHIIITIYPTCATMIGSASRAVPQCQHGWKIIFFRVGNCRRPPSLCPLLSCRDLPTPVIYGLRGSSTLKRGGTPCTYGPNFLFASCHPKVFPNMVLARNFKKKSIWCLQRFFRKKKKIRNRQCFFFFFFLVS